MMYSGPIATGTSTTLAFHGTLLFVVEVTSDVGDSGFLTSSLSFPVSGTGGVVDIDELRSDYKKEVTDAQYDGRESYRDRELIIHLRSRRKICATLVRINECISYKSSSKANGIVIQSTYRHLFTVRSDSFLYYLLSISFVRRPTNPSSTYRAKRLIYSVFSSTYWNKAFYR